MSRLVLLIFVSSLVGNLIAFSKSRYDNHPNDEGETWGYVTVRPKAHMFYWHYQTTHPHGYKNRPLILWLQGGPGGSGTGFGNFKELGPLDTNLNPRNSTWVQTASVLFIDNPVGTGFSYAEDDSAFTTNVDEIASDLLSVMKAFMQTHSDYQEVPFFIFSESYGGKMTAAFSATLYQAIKKGEIKMNFRGLAMGDSWISPVDIVNSWGPYLYATSNVDGAGLSKIQAAAKRVEDLVKEGQFSKATDAWSQAESVVEEVTGGVNFYNILDWSSEESLKFKWELYVSPVDKQIHRHLKRLHGDSLSSLMNGPIKRKLKIIPENVTWGGQSGQVFSKQSVDFMKNVTDTVNYLINETPLTVVVYEGQLDLICDAMGAETWFNRLDIAKEFSEAKRTLRSCKLHPTACFYEKKYKNVEFYWILYAGHMAPADNAYGTLQMVNEIIGGK